MDTSIHLLPRPVNGLGRGEVRTSIGVLITIPVMAIHAGWRGLAAGIVSQGIKTLKSNFEIKPENLAVLMGPCLSKKSFEVGPEVIAAFEKDYPQFMTKDVFSTCYTRGQKERSFFCLRSYAFYVLRSLGLSAQSISIFDQCTSMHNKNWYSYRKEAPLKAHNWSWISKQP